MTFIRVCQSCGNRQEDKKPDDNKDVSDTYFNRKCKKCGSRDLDYGSDKDE